MNALRVFWKYTTVKDKFAITFFAFFMPALIVSDALEKQSRGAVAKGFWAFSALVFFFYYMGIFALIFGLYRQAKKAKNVADLT
ncbi:MULTISPECIES: hypothetical protein [unclassified Rhizobium]|uniref:hypothetical protein n=1 Tax=unclassified Rhizobium TaxID=2613769 RepID=UPI000713FCFE|nr:MULTISPECIES: hypothetical protein [unclassified Rhizobium]KQS91195.1 hypothetical protein ASG42_12015 [Rhizobium sp. Leaf391]KQS96198.1 hypothetical protein ASG50_03765 [Rhizobium sp. Leaf386]KQU09727.1 hypothetical protein ASG68_01610 [Rhizobium sp. Leaf453]